ncbi:unnamed protein product [Mytilus edulis]|uniref:Uncharacterized protein n=1 Tax=Mytilus edulis TaxID=6550 RepID=A0A8S3RSH2_MYTED|nr:unnamed protein product [Mytilus edulis]
MSYILEEVFKDLPSLSFLHLSNNQIATLKGDVFKDLPELFFLFLDGNQISTIEKRVFEDLPSLYFLYLENNQITTIQDGLFKDLPRLFSVDLRGNRITFIQNDTFEHNLDLFSLKLDLVCDCNVPFWSWLKLNTRIKNFNVTCLDHNNVQLSSLEIGDFDSCTLFNEDGNNRNAVIIGVVIGIVGLVIIVVVIFLIKRRSICQTFQHTSQQRRPSVVENDNELYQISH